MTMFSHRPVYCDSAAVGVRLALLGLAGWACLAGIAVLLADLWGAL